MKQPRFVAIEGNIGAGKTTISTQLAQAWGASLILEQFTDNPFLPLFYENPERYAFPVELFFMSERHKQLQDALSKTSLFEPNIVADYFFLKTLLFASHNLHAEEFRLFQRLFNALNTSFTQPDLLVYLHRPVPALLANIALRGREFEQKISAEYLEKVQNSYFSFFKQCTQLPILILDIQDIDLRLPEPFARFTDLISQEWTPQIHRVDF